MKKYLKHRGSMFNGLVEDYQSFKITSRTFIEDAEIGEVLSVTIIEMEEEEYDKLPEWDG